MLIEKNKPNVVKGILFTGLLTLLASCGNTSALEGMIQADPKLIGSNVESTNNDFSNSESDTTTSTVDKSQANGSVVEKKEIPLKTSPDAEDLLEDSAVKPAPRQRTAETTETSLPANFPQSFPIYPKVSLKETKVGDDQESGMLTWTSSDNSKAIADYYQAELTANNWEIIKPFAFDSKGDIDRAIAIKDNHKVHLTLLRSRNKETGNNGTKLSAIYEPSETNIASSNSKTKKTKAKPNSSSNPRQDKQENTNEEVDLFPDVVRKKQNNLATKNLEDSDYIPSSSSDFVDLDSVTEPLRQPLETVAALGILTPYTQEGNVEVSKFAPNAIITRGEYARWLIAANNLYHDGDSGKKIYVINNPTQPAFQDVKSDNPDFGAIQGLAEAGLIPSRLTQDSTKLLFRPDAPLTREDLVTWKVPLDTRQALPKASIEAIEESWGFQDAANIDSSAIRALYADYQNGDRSNVRRIFGFTTIFQAKKTVTRAEAAASLWYFGFQGDGITAQEILELEGETESNS